MSKKIIHLVCTQHFDLVWRREIKWYKQRRIEIYRQAINLLEQDKETKFTFNQTQPLREFFEVCPKEKDKFFRLLSENRIEIIGGVETLADLNLNSTKSIMDNIESGLEYWQREFNHKVKGCALEDIFGLPATLPALVNSYYEYFKSGRVSKNGYTNVGGDFILSGLDNSKLRCISPESDFSLWGWGESQNPDEPEIYTQEKRHDTLFDALHTAMKSAKKEHSLFCCMGEEHYIFMEIAKLVQELNSLSTEVEIIFSTYDKYYRTISTAGWNAAPRYNMQKEDFSRLFTGCYTTRLDSKRNPKILENLIWGGENAGEVIPDDVKQSLYLMQFHDAICGCHINDNADYLDKIFQEAHHKIKDIKLSLPWKSKLPKFQSQSYKSRAIGDFSFGHWSFKFKNQKHLESITCKKKKLNSIAKVTCRQENGTLWTEEYTGKHFAIENEEEIITGINVNKDFCQIASSYFDNNFLQRWHGYSRLKYTKIFTFSLNSQLIKIDFYPDFLGNSTEISLAYSSKGSLSKVHADIFLGSVQRYPYKADIVQGDAFAAPNWVKCADFSVLNFSSPSYALRDGKLENIVLRSPVKRWSPWFPVTPDERMWDNGPKELHFLYCANDDCSTDYLHKLSREFSLSAVGSYNTKTPEHLNNLPENILFLGYVNNKCLLLETNGLRTEWNNTLFSPREFKMMSI